MKVKKPVIEYKNISRKWPIQITISWVLIVKTFDLLSTTIGTLIVGALSLALLALWGWGIIDLMKYDEEPIDIFKPKDITDAKSKSLRGNRRQPVVDDEDDEFVR